MPLPPLLHSAFANEKCSRPEHQYQHHPTAVHKSLSFPLCTFLDSPSPPRLCIAARPFQSSRSTTAATGNLTYQPLSPPLTMLPASVLHS